MLDYIIVGVGLSGLAVAEKLLEKGREIRVFDNRSQSSSGVAGGIFNPVILKRFTLARGADEQLAVALPFYRELEKKLDISVVKELPVFRKFNSVEEQNNWFSAMDKDSVAPFLDAKLVPDINPCIPSEFSFGRVRQTGTINTALLLDHYREYLSAAGAFSEEAFDYNELQVLDNGCGYKNLQAKRVIFCDGFGITQNPFFRYLPLRGNKGEYIIIRSEDLKLEVAVKSSVFILPLGNDLYKVGATYNHKDTTNNPTSEAKEYLLEKLSKLITCEFEVVDQVAGIRPATTDRAPLVGQHPKYANLYCCNGFGSRGVLIGPTVAGDLVDFIEDGKPLPPDVDISRFENKYYSGLR